MLKSFSKLHDGKHNIIIMENSTNEETSKLLDGLNVGYIRTVGRTHSPSINEALTMCDTKYALIVDSDIVFTQPIDKLLSVMENNNGAMMGEVCGSRGGFIIKDRIHPWFCLVDVSQIRKARIKWHDQKRIDESCSGYFFNSVPINPIKGNVIPFYDNGSTFYEDVVKSGLKVLSAPGVVKYFTHYEGSSWHRFSDNEAFKDWGEKVYQEFKIAHDYFKDINIKDKYAMLVRPELSSSILFIQPIFVPNDDFFKINTNSITSILKYMRAFPFRNMKVVFGGYCKSDEHWEKISGLISELKPDWLPEVVLERVDKNYGKAYVVNKLYKESAGQKFDYLMTMDSDIVFDVSEYDLFNRLVKTASDSSKVIKAPFGMLALNQKGQSCHMMEIMDKRVAIGDEIICWSSQMAGIAGGALFISSKIFNDVGGYREMGVYSGDDGFLLNDIQVRGHSSTIIESTSIIHPSDNHMFDGKYLKWKHDQLEKCKQTSGGRTDKMAEIAAGVEALWEKCFEQ